MRRSSRFSAHLRGILLLAGLLVAPPALAVENRAAGWFGAVLNGDLGSEDWSRWLYTLQGEYRTFDALDGTRQILGRSGIGYRLDGGWRVFARFDYYHTNSPAIGSFRELRAQQIVYWTGQGPGTSTVKLRGILEQRWIDERDGTAWRLRPRVRFEWPSRRFARLDWVVFAETFIDLRDVGWVDSGWNQQRFFAGLRHPLRPGLDLETGYQYQWLNPLGTGDLVNHTLLLMFRFR